MQTTGKASGCGTGTRLSSRLSSSVDGEDGIILIVDLNVNFCTRRNCGIDVAEVRFGTAGELQLLDSLLKKVLFPFDIVLKGGGSLLDTYLVLGIVGLVTVSEQVHVQVILQYKVKPRTTLPDSGSRK